MTIRVKLILISLLPMVTVLAVGVVLALMVQGIWTARQRQNNTSEIVKGVFELNALTSEYIQHPNERIRQQWNQRYESLSDLLQRLEYEELEQQQLLVRMRRRYEELSATILGLTELRAQALPENDPVAHQWAQQLDAQLMNRSQALVALATRLAAIDTTEVTMFQNRALIWLVTLLLLMAGVVGGSAWLIARDITRALGQLRSDIRIVGGGNLEHQLAADRRDEIGQLAQAFNDMSWRLRRITVSRDELQHEIYERKRAEQAIQKSEQRFRTLASTANDAIVLANQCGRITYFNSAAERMFGYSQEEATNQPLTLLIPAGFREAHEQGFSRYLKTREPHMIGKTTEVVGRHKSGTEFPVEISLAVHEQDSELTFTGILRDITERKQAEAGQQKLTNALRRSNKDLEQFAYIASHDLQEPLRKVEGFGDMLQEHLGQALDEESRDYMNRIGSATRRMRELINGLLTYSRVTTKASAFEPVDLQAVAREVVSDLELRIQETEGQVQVSDIPPIHADRLQMRQLLQNLIGNSLKFHRPGVPPRVKVWGEVVGPENGQTGAAPRLCRILFQDNGIGIDPQYVKQLFIPFRRLHGRSSPYPGTGIGLAVCRKIVERHGGTIRIESTPGKGATFIVTLPYRPPEEPPREESLP